MALYLIGDVQGCDAPLGHLLQTLDFSPSRDQLVVLGDLVNRGPDSVGVLRRLQKLGNAAQGLLGNHDLHLLAVAQGVRTPHRNDTLHSVLQAADRDALLDWLRHRPLALQAQGWLLVHAGVLPQWTAAQTLELAGEVERMLQSAEGPLWLHQMYGNRPSRWKKSLEGPDRWRVVVNALTRLRFCDAKGTMEFDTKDSAAAAPDGYMPWFDVPNRKTADTPIAFGHWSTLGLIHRPKLLALDTGCVWGGSLTAARLAEGGQVDIIQVPCPQAQKPGQ